MLRAIAVFGLLLTSMFVFGPRAHVELDNPASQVPPDGLGPTWQVLEETISHREQTRTHPVADTDAHIVWADQPYQPTSWSIVYIHGFSASRQETAPLAQEIAQALGANRFEARLTGHGQSGAELGQASAEDWLRDTREAILIGQKLGERTLIIGVSTGATLVSLVAVHDHIIRPHDALAFFSPNYGPKNTSAELLLWPWAEYWAPWIAGSTRSWTPQNKDHGTYWTTTYPVTALFPMMAVVKAAEQSLVEQIQTPIHMFVSPLDPVVDARRTRAVYDRMVASSTRAWTEVDGPGDNHVLAGRILSPERTNKLKNTLVDWLEKLPTPK